MVGGELERSITRPLAERLLYSHRQRLPDMLADRVPLRWKRTVLKRALVEDHRGLKEFLKGPFKRLRQELLDGRVILDGRFGRFGRWGVQMLHELRRREERSEPPNGIVRGRCQRGHRVVVVVGRERREAELRRRRHFASQLYDHIHHQLRGLRKRRRQLARVVAAASVLRAAALELPCFKIAAITAAARPRAVEQDLVPFVVASGEAWLTQDAGIVSLAGAAAPRDVAVLEDVAAGARRQGAKLGEFVAHHCRQVDLPVLHTVDVCREPVEHQDAIEQTFSANAATFCTSQQLVKDSSTRLLRIRITQLANGGSHVW